MLPPSCNAATLHHSVLPPFPSTCCHPPHPLPAPASQPLPPFPTPCDPGPHRRAAGHERKETKRYIRYIRYIRIRYIRYIRYIRRARA